MSSGRPTRQDQKMTRIWFWERLMGVLLGGLGRILMKLSCDASQLIAFRNRSRLPLKPTMPLAMKSALPKTAKRPSSAGLAPGKVPAMAKVKGPWRAVRGSRLTWRRLKLLEAKLAEEVSSRGVTLALEFLTSPGSTVRA